MGIWPRRRADFGAECSEGTKAARPLWNAGVVLARNLEARGRDTLAVERGEIRDETRVKLAIESSEGGLGAHLGCVERLEISHLERRHGIRRRNTRIFQAFDDRRETELTPPVGPLAIGHPFRKSLDVPGPFGQTSGDHVEQHLIEIIHSEGGGRPNGEVRQKG